VDRVNVLALDLSLTATGIALPAGVPATLKPGGRTLGTYPGDRCGRHDRRDLPQLELDLEAPAHG
jgi:hypothetical protein